MRIELDAVQALALRACQANAERARVDARDLDAKVEDLLVDARRLKAQARSVREAAASNMTGCWQTIATCHALKSIPMEAEMTMGDPVTITWDDDAPADEPVVDDHLSGS